MNVSTILSSVLVISIFLVLTTISIPLKNNITTIQEVIDELQPLRNGSDRPLVILFWCPNPENETCNMVNDEAMRWRQLPSNNQQPSAVAAAIGGGLGAALGGGLGAGIGSLSLVPFAHNIIGGATGALGGGVGGAAGGTGGAIGGAIGGGIGSGIGGTLGLPGGFVGGLAGGSLGAGLGSYYISNGTFPDVVGRLNATLVPFSQAIGPTLNSTWNSFLTDFLLIGPEDNVLTLLGDYEEDLIDTDL